MWPAWVDALRAVPASSWTAAGVLFSLIVMVVFAARYLAVRYLSAFADASQTQIDDVLLLLARKTNALLVIVVAALLAGASLSLSEGVNRILRGAVLTCVFLQVAFWGNALINFFLSQAAQKAEQGGANLSARRALAYFVRAALWMLLVSMLLDNFGVRLGALLAGIGIGGVAVALALQSILGDLFCYVAIILDKPFVAGDFLVLGEIMGTVERIGMKTTRIRSLSGELLILANHDLVNSRIRNYKTLEERRVAFKFGVTYDTPVDQVALIPQRVREVFATLENARLDRVHFAQLGDSGLTFEVVYFVLSGDYTRYMDLQQHINLSLLQTLGKENIDFAYPTQTVHFHAATPRRS